MNFYDEVRDLLLLFSLPESWNSLVMVVSNYVPSSGTLKFDDVVSVILSEEMLRKRTCEASSNALTMESRGRQRDREEGSQVIAASLGRAGPSPNWER